MNKTLQKILIVLGVVAAIVVVCVLLSQREKTDFHEKYENADLTRESVPIQDTSTAMLMQQSLMEM